MIDRYLLRYFLAVVDNGNFSRAARQMNVTQPTLSVGISKLEDELGTKLFHRTNKRIEITQAGSKLLSYARRIENDFNQIPRELQGQMPAHIYRFGVLNSISSFEVQNIVRSVCGLEAGLRFEIHDGSERDLNNLLSRGRIDFALSLVGRGGGRFNEIAIREEGYGMAMSNDHTLALEAEIQGEHLADNTMIVRQHCEVLSETSRFFTERGVRPFFAYKSNNDDRILKMVEAGLGVTLVPMSYASQTIKVKKLLGFNYTRTIGLLWTAQSDADHTNIKKIIPLIESALTQ